MGIVKNILIIGVVLFGIWILKPVADPFHTQQDYTLAWGIKIMYSLFFLSTFYD